MSDQEFTLQELKDICEVLEDKDFQASVRQGLNDIEAGNTVLIDVNDLEAVDDN